MLIDLHCHTKFSNDNYLEPKELIKRIKDLHIDGVCITEHHSFKASYPVERIGIKEDLLVLRGVEVHTDLGHLLIYGVKDDSWNIWSRNNYLRIERVIEIARKTGAVCIPSHPFRISGSESIGKAIFKLEGISAIETHNGLNSDEENEWALEAAFTLNLPSIGGSDCHKKSQVGRCLTEFEWPIHDINGLVKAIKAGSCRGIKNPHWTEAT